MNYSVFVSCPKGLEYLLEDELKTLGLQVTRVNPQGVYGDASLAVIYHLCLWSRIANRVQLILFSGHAHNQQTLYQLCMQYPWHTMFTADKTLAIEFHGTTTQIRNSMFGAQVVKDAIVDYYRKLSGTRPTIDRANPQILLHAYLKNDVLTVSFDLTGYSLHQRGYRRQSGLAPLKENVAAALLIRAKWPELASQGYTLQDPFCGAGTLVIEAAMMAANIAPGLIRDDQALPYWTQHQSSLWEKIRLQALKQVKPVHVKLSGSDSNERSLSLAQANAERAGVKALVTFTKEELAHCRPAAKRGLLICNPPYGERLGDETQLIPLYQQLGQVLHEHFQGWQAAVLTSNPLLAKAMGLRSNKQYRFYNGSLECKLYCVTMEAKNQLKDDQQKSLSSGALMFKNRLMKNYNHLQKWVKRQQVSCYRVYDADLPEYAYAIDIYGEFVVLQEYAAPASIPLHKAARRSLDVIQVVPQVLGIAPQSLVMKQRKQQKGTQQYQKLSQEQQKLVVHEGRAKFIVNLYDYLDTGLFLDHRLLRLRFAELPRGTRFLNCFCYTATASVHAALNGALTTSVDLSNTYLNWAKDNFKLNQLDVSKHQFIQAECLSWLKICRERFDVVFLDPPSFSNSKRMTGTLDIQRDHEALIRAAMRLLYPGGTLYFSSNLRNFKLSPQIMSDFQVKNMTSETIDIDFKRNPKIHCCFMIKK